MCYELWRIKFMKWNIIGYLKLRDCSEFLTEFDIVIVKLITGS